MVWPPKEDHVAYENVNSTNAAGILEYMDVVGNEIIAIMGTLEHPNIGVFDKVDPLFLKFDTKGNITRKVWLSETPDINEATISAFKIKNNQYCIAWGPGNDYDKNWEAGAATISIIDSNGEFIVKPEKLNYSFGTYSEIIQLNDGRIVWANAGSSPSSKIHIFVGQFK